MVEAFNYKVFHQQSASIEKNFSIFYRRLTTLAWFHFSLEWFFTISELLSIAELPLYAEVNVNAETFSMGLKTIRLQLKNIKEEFQWRLHKKIRCHLHRRFLVELYGKHDKKSLSVMTTKKKSFHNRLKNSIFATVSFIFSFSICLFWIFVKDAGEKS